MAFPISCGNYFGSWCQLDTLPCPPTCTKDRFFLLKNFPQNFLRSFFEQHLQGLFWWMTQVVSSQGEVRHMVECMQMFQVLFQTHQSVNIQSAFKMNWSSLIGLCSIQVNPMEIDKIHMQSTKMKNRKVASLISFSAVCRNSKLNHSITSLQCHSPGTSSKFSHLSRYWVGPQLQLLAERSSEAKLSGEGGE